MPHGAEPAFIGPPQKRQSLLLFPQQRVGARAIVQGPPVSGVQLLHEAGLLDAHDLSNSKDKLVWLPSRLTYAGHEFLDAARKDTLWQKAKAITLEKSGGLSFEALKAVLLKLAVDAATGAGS